jgi:hypothetical protein
MQRSIGVMILATALGLVNVSNAMAVPLAAQAGDAASGQRRLVQEAQYWRGGHCERLRRACIHKEERREVGEGNCRRYRAECGGRVSYCERLRRACIYKEERGETGLGNCQRYREECRRG